MNRLLAVKQALTVLDAVLRTCAHATGLEASEVVVLAMLAQKPGRSASEVALFSGHARQHAHRALKVLASRGLVVPSRWSFGKVAGWTLSEAGREAWGRVARRLSAYDRLLEARVSLSEVVELLERMVEAVVNRPSPEGWRKGLVTLHESRKDPNWDRVDRERQPE